MSRRPAMFRSVLVFAGALPLLNACIEVESPTPAQTDEAQSGLTETSPDGRYIVGYANSNGRATAAAAGQVLFELPNHGASVMHLPDHALNALRNNPNIAYVEVDARRYPMAETSPYGIGMVQADQVPAAPAGGDAGRTKVCIIDSGLAAAHEDFAGLPVSGSNNAGSGAWNDDLCGHGTHVAGTIAAVSGNGIGVVGVAPQAVRLHIVKVFGGADCAWTYSSSLVAALDVCEANGAKVVSMSLGGSTKSRTEENAFNQAWNAGLLPIAAAGNDGNTRKSYPASYASVMSVAALDANGDIASFSQQNDAVEIAAPGVGVLSTYPYANVLTVGGVAHHGEPMEGAGSGNVNGALADGGLCTASGAWAGRIVLCARGDISFAEKVQAAQAGGAIGAVVYNNEAGPLYATMGTATTTMPVITLTQAEGQALVASSIGAQANLLSGLGNGYATLDGTSMATPHVSGVAGLVWAQFPNASNQEIRDALTATAVDLGAAGRDNAFGYGLVQAGAAYNFLQNGGGGGGNDPVCVADGTCNAACAAGADPDCGGGVCAPAGDTCSANSECCSGNCRVRRGVGTCR